MYKFAKKRFYKLKESSEKKKYVSLVRLGGDRDVKTCFLMDAVVVILVRWTRPNVLRDWLKEKGYDVGFLFIGYCIVS